MWGKHFVHSLAACCNEQLVVFLRGAIHEVNLLLLEIHRHCLQERGGTGQTGTLIHPLCCLCMCALFAGHSGDMRDAGLLSPTSHRSIHGCSDQFTPSSWQKQDHPLRTELSSLVPLSLSTTLCPEPRGIQVSSGRRLQLSNSFAGNITKT